MVSETVEAPATEPVVTDPAPEPAQTEAPPETPSEETAESAAAPSEEAAVPQVEVVEEKPEYVTREQWEKEKAEVAQRAAAEALERDRRQRQTAEARRVNREKREAEDRAETADIVRATLASKTGIDPQLIADDAITLTIDRAASRKAQTLAAGVLDSVDQAFDYLTGPVFGKEVDLDEGAEEAAKRLGPKLQLVIDTIRPVIEANARKDHIHKDDLPKHVDAEIARRNAKANEGKEELKRPEGVPPPVDTSTIAEHLDRIGTPQETPADRAWWNAREKARGRG